MRRRGALVFSLALTACVLAAGCRKAQPQGPTRDEAVRLLRAEAEAAKAIGEKLDPVLRVKASWTIADVEVRDQPADAENPWAGAVRFEIRVETKDVDGSVSIDQMARRFEYVWSRTLQRWIPAPTSAARS